MTSGSGERGTLGARGEEQGSAIADALFEDHNLGGSGASHS
jgi:hypothetical protein